MSEKMSEGKSVVRFAPCPDYDIEGTEKWLEEMAEKGLLLKKDGFTGDFVSFEANAPKHAKYRLEAAQKSTSMWADNGGDPDEEQIELSERYSWEYVSKRKDFYVYRSFDPEARELNTDPEVQAMALNAVKKRKRQNLFTLLVMVFIYPVILTRGCLLLTVLTLKTWLALIVAVLLVWAVIDSVRGVRGLSRYQKVLRGEAEAPDKLPEKNSGRKRLAARILNIALLDFFVICLIRGVGLRVSEEGREALKDYAGTLPFATVRDLGGEGASGYELSGVQYVQSTNTVKEDSDWLAARIIDYNENASVTTSAGQRISGHLYVDYYEMKCGWLAEVLAKELFRTEKRQKGYEPMDPEIANELSEEAVYSFYSVLHVPTVIIVRGNEVVKAMFFETNAEELVAVTEWVRVMVGH